MMSEQAVSWRDHSVLITGGTGSFGKKLVEVMLREHRPKKLIVFSRDELKQHEMRQQFPDTGDTPMRYFIGDVRDRDRLYRALDGVDYVIHAAALKQVQACEYNPIEAVKTNVLGAANVIDAAIDRDVKRVVALSTDKAANPVNLYGATKLCADKLFVAANSYSGSHGTRFSVLRYGNVLGSRGSVVPHFLKMREKGRLPITDPRMTRFWLSLEQGVSYILWAMGRMQGGEIFVPKIPSMSMVALARAIAPECPTDFTGIRPGEKLHEVMIPEDDSHHTVEFDDHFAILSSFSDGDIQKYLQDNGGHICPDGFRYASDTNSQWLSAEELQGIVERAESDLNGGHGHGHIGAGGAPVKTQCRPRTAHLCAASEPSSAKLAIVGGTPIRTAMLPYGRQSVNEDDLRAVLEALRSDWLTTGPGVAHFERVFARFVGVGEAVAVSSGTAALHTAMSALGVGPGDEVVVPAMTFAATANCVLFQGGTPVFADVDPLTLLLDPAAVAAKITPRTKAILAVDYAGQPCDYETLRDIAGRHGLALVDDACHAVGGSYRGRPVGALADLNTFSFHPVKHLTTGEGGMVTTEDARLAQSMRNFRNHGITTDHRQRAEQGSFFYEMVDLGYNYRLTDFQCALGMTQLRRLPGFVRRRREIAARYDRAFADLPLVRPLGVREGIGHAYHLYVVQFELSELTADRAQLFAALRAEGIGVNVHYIPVHLHPFYRERLGTGPGLCPVAEASYERLVSLPIFPGMTDADADDVIDAVDKVMTYYRK